MDSFLCSHCHQPITAENLYGSRHRNHCPYCLWSKHQDDKWPGDRKANCQSQMQPLGLTFKHEGFDKFTGKPKKGEIMIIHQCLGCNKISLNRLAGDDSPEAILAIFKKSQALAPEIKDRLEEQKIQKLTKNDEEEIKTQLFGKKN